MMIVSGKAHALRKLIPSGGLFANKSWRIAPDPILIPQELFDQINALGVRLHAFNKACNLLYRQSVEGKQPEWIHRYLDTGKPDDIIQLSREKIWKNNLPHVIRPDLLVTEDGFIVSELDSVPGGIGLTAWLQTAYATITNHQKHSTMFSGFLSSLQSHNGNIAIVVSEESKDYRPEMEWLSKQDSKLNVCSPADLEYQSSGVYLHGKQIHTIYRFFELFDLPNIVHIEKLIDAAKKGLVQVTPPFKPQLEEKLWFALFWFPQLAEFWRRELGDRYLRDLKKIIPFTWLLDPTPLPPHATIPYLNINHWEQLMKFSQKQRDLILKISGFSEHAWGSRGVFLGSDMSSEDWKKVVTHALQEFKDHPYILQSFVKTRLIEHSWYNFEKETTVIMKGRLRLCPYYFVEGDKPKLCGILATLCPTDKKLIHGMQDAILTLACPQT